MCAVFPIHETPQTTQIQPFESLEEFVEFVKLISEDVRDQSLDPYIAFLYIDHMIQLLSSQ